MVKAFFLAIAAINGLTIGNLAAIIIQMIFGDRPTARFLKAICGAAAGIGYFIFCTWIMFVSEMDLITGAIFVFAPLLLLLVLYAIKK